MERNPESIEITIWKSFIYKCFMYNDFINKMDVEANPFALFEKHTIWGKLKMKNFKSHIFLEFVLIFLLIFIEMLINGIAVHQTLLKIQISQVLTPIPLFSASIIPKYTNGSFCSDCYCCSWAYSILVDFFNRH